MDSTHGKPSAVNNMSHSLWGTDIYIDGQSF